MVVPGVSIGAIHFFIIRSDLVKGRAPSLVRLAIMSQRLSNLEQAQLGSSVDATAIESAHDPAATTAPALISPPACPREAEEPVQ